MKKTRDNHYVAQWYQEGFMDARDKQLCYLTKRNIPLKNGEQNTIHSKKWHTTAQKLYEKDLYSTFFGTDINDDIERKLFGPIDDNGSKSVKAFLTDDHGEWHKHFQDFFIYLDAQKLRTPKGLAWIRSKYPELSQIQLMMEMQSLRSIHCTLWAEGVRELVSAEDSDIKFIISDHPVTIYNYACPPNSELCKYPNDPDIALKGSQTIFPLSKNRCLILTNLEYAKDPENVNPLSQRTNAKRVRYSMVNTIDFINCRKLTSEEVTKINHIIKSRSHSCIAAGREEWLYPESHAAFDWAELKHVLLPPPNQTLGFGGEIYAQFDDGSVHYQDAFGRADPPNEFLRKSTDESQIGRNDYCGCGSGKKYKICCRNIPADMRTSWDSASIRERNLALCNCIRSVLGLDSGKTWTDVRRELTDNQVSEIYGFYSALWPRDTDIYSLLPKPDGKLRALYTGIIDPRTISLRALPMASLFDDYLIESPIQNPNNVKPEFSPVNSPSKFKYQALKDFLFMLEIEPFIGLNLVNLIPSLMEFDADLMEAAMEIAAARTPTRNICKLDRKRCFELATEDLLNTIATLPQTVKIKALTQQFGLTEEDAKRALSDLESQAESSPLMMLQRFESGQEGQFLQFKMAPNYELSLLTAQATGSVLITDSGSRWQELLKAQHTNQGIVNYPWHSALQQIHSTPLDYRLLENLQKTQGPFATLRQLMRTTDCMILSNDRNAEKIKSISDQATAFMNLIKDTTNHNNHCSLNILSPEGGLYDTNVQRLLARSNCPRYDNQVRSIYGIGIPGQP
ncbi:DUF4238 domain-containing protein [Pseudomonas sp. zjy_11]|uniref:DUF4238 domain-containing protein n=1 Tax=unclassified Pseudomonas TaxID=196821 RepID=UPI00370A0423